MTQREKWTQLLPRGVFIQQAEAEAGDVHFSRCNASRVLCGWGVRAHSHRTRKQICVQMCLRVLCERALTSVFVEPQVQLWLNPKPNLFTPAVSMDTATHDVASVTEQC